MKIRAMMLYYTLTTFSYYCFYTEALIQLEDSIYTAREGQNESVSVCAVVAKPISNCPIDFVLKINGRFGKCMFHYAVPHCFKYCVLFLCRYI